jgi:carboxylate-amine ligase
LTRTRSGRRCGVVGAGAAGASGGTGDEDEAICIAAIFQAIIAKLWKLRRDNITFRVYNAELIEENKWRAARYGLEAIIILDAEGNEQLVTEHLLETLNRLEPVAAKLGCSDELADVEKIISRGAGYQRQRRVAAEHGGDLRAVVLDLVKQMRNGPTA